MRHMQDVIHIEAPVEHVWAFYCDPTAGRVGRRRLAVACTDDRLGPAHRPVTAAQSSASHHERHLRSPYAGM